MNTPHTFPRTARLTRTRDFDRVFQTGRRYRTAHLILTVAPGATETDRVGLVVSRKFGKAVRRNRFRRLVREAFRLHRGEFHFPPRKGRRGTGTLESPVDIVVLPRQPGPAMYGLTRNDLEHELAPYLTPCAES